jgi:hypothetical protein
MPEQPEIQTVIIQFPDLGGSLEGETSDKVPTQLCHHKGEWKWGFEIPEDVPRYQWFKLHLSSEHKNEELTMLAIDHPDLKALPPSYKGDPAAVKLSTMFLSKIRDHVVEILRLQLGNPVIETTRIHYTITVPAIWNDTARAQTQDVASGAGMGDSIQIISEPEAAMMYVFHAMNPENLKVEDKVLLVDAGGGTVDLITYTVESLQPIVEVREAVPGSGHACGSIFLNRIFRQWLAGHLRNLEGYDEDTLDEAMKEFEETTKRKFTGEEQTVKIGVPGMMDCADKGIKRQKLTIPASLLKSIFNPVMGMITTLVQAQLQQAKNAKAIVLVGGFGRSPYLRKCIQQVVGSELDILQPPYGWTAVVRGALLRALHEASIQAPRVQISSRIARRAYGIKWNVTFDEDLHQGLSKYVCLICRALLRTSSRKWDNFKGVYRVTQMAWLVKKVHEQHFISHIFRLTHHRATF